MGVAAVKRAMLERSQLRMLLLDHTKFDQSNMEVICPLTAIDQLVTDRPPNGELSAALRRARVELESVSSD
jgi:DeoR/GlpR family transcriptional regulator of sugar metabolism